MSEQQAAGVEPEVELDEEQLAALQDERWARIEAVESQLEELHAVATPECVTAFESLTSFF